ncbi:MAG: hypothetical protein Q4F29_12500 [Lachnospiraceae bacterium]|nr:hypothetical protein [Lachnospiraceae bacterium]
MNNYTSQQIQETRKIIESSIANCEKIQPKLKEGSPQLSLSRNRIKALYIVKALLAEQENVYTKDELEKAIVQITSIKNKSTTGISHTKEGSGTDTRFFRLITAMDIALDYLQNAMQGGTR